LKTKLIDDYLVNYNKKLWFSLTDFTLHLILSNYIYKINEKLTIY
jgi:hypothetical protein